MAEEKTTYPFRILYRREDGTQGVYYIKEENASCSLPRNESAKPTRNTKTQQDQEDRNCP